MEYSSLHKAVLSFRPSCLLELAWGPSAGQGLRHDLGLQPTSCGHDFCPSVLCFQQSRRKDLAILEALGVHRLRGRGSQSLLLGSIVGLWVTLAALVGVDSAGILPRHRGPEPKPTVPKKCPSPTPCPCALLVQWASEGCPKIWAGRPKLWVRALTGVY